MMTSMLCLNYCSKLSNKCLGAEALRNYKALRPWERSCRCRLAARVGATEKEASGPADAQPSLSQPSKFLM